jgi:hypothetical protein
MPTDIEELTQNLKQNNGEITGAIVMLMSLLQKVAAKLNDPELTSEVNAVKDHIKAIEVPRRDPPGCRLSRFEDLPAEVQRALGEGWRGFFNQSV